MKKRGVGRKDQEGILILKQSLTDTPLIKLVAHKLFNSSILVDYILVVGYERGDAPGDDGVVFCHDDFLREVFRCVGLCVCVADEGVFVVFV